MAERSDPEVGERVPRRELSSAMGPIVILTGAGVSAESGIRTFRGPDGLWEGHRVEEVATPEGFARDPALVYAFYNARRQSVRAALPNAAHLALARLERELSAPVTLVTQNIDDLHERAGSRHVIHMHGELLKARCCQCEAVVPWTEDLDGGSVCPECRRSGVLRPHVVWFGEIPLRLEEIAAAIEGASLFVAIGTSGQVYPAAGFAAHAAALGVRTIEVNPESTPISPVFDRHLRGPAGVEVPRLVEEWLGGVR